MKTDNHPRVSVVMPALNGEKYLCEAVDSILAQSFTDFEFIVINDGSTDGTAGILGAYEDERIKVVTNDHSCGVARSLNRGISIAQGEYIARMDCDDISSPDRFVTQVKFLDDNLSVDLVGSWIDIIDPSSRLTGQTWKYPASAMRLRWVAFFNAPVAHPAVMMRRRIFDLGQRYSDSLCCGQDYDLWTRLIADFSFSNIQRALLKYRIHDSGISSSRRSQQAESRCLISHRTISSYLGTNTPLEAVRLILQPCQVQSIATYNSSVCILRQLYLKFRKDHSLQPSEIVCINLDLADRLILLSSKNRQFLSSRLTYLWAIALVIYTRVFDSVRNRGH